MWRRCVVYMLVASILVLTLGAGVALAATLIGAGGPDRIFGTARADWIDGRTGNDRIYGGGGEDEIQGGPGNDFIRANDDSSRDYVDCGPGFDTFTTTVAPLSSRDVYRNCEFRSIPDQPMPRGQRTIG
jgi:Ca2+-binding RTX toxin-like protein